LNITSKQTQLDEQWEELIIFCKHKGYLLHAYEGVALISKHEIQMLTSTKENYLNRQIINGNCPEKLGLDKCDFRDCYNCHLKQDKAI